MVNQTEIMVILSAKDRMSAALTKVKKETAATYAELKSLNAMKNVNIKVDPQKHLQLANKNVQNLKAKLNGMKTQLKLIDPNETTKLSKANAQINYMERNLKLAQIEASKLSLSGRLSGGLKNASSSVDNFKNKMQGISRVGALAFAGVAKLTYDYSKGVAQLGTITGLSAKKNNQLADAVSKTAANMGTDPVESLEAAYQGFSSSLIKTSNDAVPVIKSMTKLSKVGGTDLTGAMDLTSSAMNSYHLKMKDMNSVSDKFITIQNKGKTKVNELKDSLGQVLPTAASVNTGLNDVGAAMISLTKNGVSTSEATTQLNALLNSMSKSSSTAFQAFKQASGKTFPEFMKSGGTLSEALKILKNSVGGSTQKFRDLFSEQRAGKAAAALSASGFQDIDQALKDMKNSTGSTNAEMKKLNATPTQKLAVAFDKLKKAATDVGNKMIPIVSNIASNISKMNPDTLRLIVEGFVALAAITPVLTAVSGVLSALGGIVTMVGVAMGTLEVEAGLLAMPFVALIGTIGLVVGALSGIAAYLVGGGDVVKGYGIM